MKRLSLKQERFVAAYLGDAQGNLTEAARRAGYKLPSASGKENLHKPLVLEIIAERRAEIRAQGIAQVEARIQAQHARWLKMQAVIAARADAYAGEAPGSDTGLLVRQIRSVGRGDDYQVVEEWAVDTGLLAELRQVEQHTAKELGQWIDHTDQIGAQLLLTPEQLVALSDDELHTHLTRLSQSAGRRGG